MLILRKLMRVDEIDKLNFQADILDKATEKALKQLDKEFKNKPRNYFNEWFRYIELVGRELNKFLN